jgi:NAD(P)-dependent dehydrogenase (short-subunit alcohol dehydrogenase family)
MSSMGNTWSQSFPPAATFTEKELPDQTGKVFIVTGSSSGVGQALAQILYSRNATVCIAARSPEKCTRAINAIQSSCPSSKGTLSCLHLDLADLSSIKKSAEEFLSKEDRLDVLFNNAAVMTPPQGSKTAQGYELQLGTNCLGPLLFTQLLTPLLIKTAKKSQPGGVRVVWVSSSAAELTAPRGGVDIANLDYKSDKAAWHKYGVSKAGNVFHATEYARRMGGEGVVSVTLNPGNLKTELQREVQSAVKWIFHKFSYEPIYGAYTELFAGLSPEVTLEHNGAWIVPWGRLGFPLRNGLQESCTPKSEGGTGVAGNFWEWSEEQIKPYL